MKKGNETGRSMVEMIAVIAIMGILSLGGIAGYTLATNRYQANRVLDVAGKLAGLGTGGTTYRSLRAAGLNLDEFPGIQMSLDRAGCVCIIFPRQDELADAVTAQSMSFRDTTSCENQGCPGLLLKF